MEMVRLIDATEIYRLLDGIKEPDLRIKAAKEKVLDTILENVEGWMKVGLLSAPAPKRHTISGSDAAEDDDL